MAIDMSSRAHRLRDRCPPTWGGTTPTANDPKPIPVSLTGTARVSAVANDDGARTVVACGFLGGHLRPFNPFIATLPRLLHIPAEGAEGWSVHAVRQAVHESRERRPGSAAVLERLSEMMFVDAVAATSTGSRRTPQVGSPACATIASEQR